MGITTGRATVRMDRQKYRLRRHLGDNARSSLRFSRSSIDEMIGELTVEILAGKTVSAEQEVTFCCPDGWLEHLKVAAVRRVFGRRYRARMMTHRCDVHFERDVLYPLADFVVPPSEFGYPVMVERLWADMPGFIESGEPRFATELDLHMALREFLYRYWTDGTVVREESIIGLLRSWGLNPGQLVSREALLKPWRDPGAP